MPIQKIATNTNTAKTLVGLRRDLPDHFRLQDRGRNAFLQLTVVAAWLADWRGANEATGAPTHAAPSADH